LGPVGPSPTLQYAENPRQRRRNFWARGTPPNASPGNDLGSASGLFPRDSRRNAFSGQISRSFKLSPVCKYSDWKGDQNAASGPCDGLRFFRSPRWASRGVKFPGCFGTVSSEAPPRGQGLQILAGQNPQSNVAAHGHKVRRGLRAPITAGGGGYLIDKAQAECSVFRTIRPKRNEASKNTPLRIHGIRGWRKTFGIPDRWRLHRGWPRASRPPAGPGALYFSYATGLPQVEFNGTLMLGRVRRPPRWLKTAQ